MIPSPLPHPVAIAFRGTTHPAYDVSFRSYISRDVTDDVKTSSRRLNWYVKKTDLFKTPLRRLTGT